MKIDHDWKLILRRAWSVRFLALAAILSGVEIILPLFSDQFDRGTFAVLSFSAVVAALFARFVAQKGL